jgi:hypothetical protein
LFTESTTKRELNAIKTGNANNLQSDALRNLSESEKNVLTDDGTHSAFFSQVIKSLW